MYHVVMGVGPEDEQALQKAEAVADLPGRADVAVTIVHVATDESAAEEVPAVRRARESLADTGVEVALEVRDGANPTEVVLAVAEDLEADCICVGGRRRSPAGKLQLRSGAQAVILNADVPVLVAGDAEGGERSP